MSWQFLQVLERKLSQFNGESVPESTPRTKAREAPVGATPHMSPMVGSRHSPRVEPAEEQGPWQVKSPKYNHDPSAMSPAMPRGDPSQGLAQLMQRKKLLEKDPLLAAKAMAESTRSQAVEHPVEGMTPLLLGSPGMQGQGTFTRHANRPRQFKTGRAGDGYDSPPKRALTQDEVYRLEGMEPFDLIEDGGPSVHESGGAGEITEASLQNQSKYINQNEGDFDFDHVEAVEPSEGSQEEDAMMAPAERADATMPPAEAEGAEAAFPGVTAWFPDEAMREAEALRVAKLPGERHSIPITCSP